MRSAITSLPAVKGLKHAHPKRRANSETSVRPAVYSPGAVHRANRTLDASQPPPRLVRSALGHGPRHNNEGCRSGYLPYPGLRQGNRLCLTAGCSLRLTNPSGESETLLWVRVPPPHVLGRFCSSQPNAALVHENGLSARGSEPKTNRALRTFPATRSRERGQPLKRCRSQIFILLTD